MLHRCLILGCYKGEYNCHENTVDHSKPLQYCDMRCYLSFYKSIYTHFITRDDSRDSISLSLVALTNFCMFFLAAQIFGILEIWN